MSREADPPRLRTLGLLALDGASLTRPKPLLLATYLVLEGRQPRRRLAGLLFGAARRPAATLAVALSRLRSAVGAALTTDARTVSLSLAIDTEDLLHMLQRSDLERAEATYAGAFLEGVPLDDTSAEFEEWVFATREFLAGQLREARLEAAEHALRSGRVETAGTQAERAMRTVGCADAEPALLARAHHVLASAGRSLARRLEAELHDWGVDVERPVPIGPHTSSGEAPVAVRTGAGAAADLVGRDTELATLRAALGPDGPRVVTLVGPGGIGKTVLATHAAAQLAVSDAYPGGVHVVPLADVADPARVVDRVAHALGVTLTGAEPAEPRLARALGSSPTLVVLDDGERLSLGVRTLLDGLRAVPTVRWLVTSREPIQAADEHLMPIVGLPVPDETVSDPVALERFGAVALYLRRRRRWATRAPDPEAWPALARLCADLGGWPLALEIAASLERVVPLPQLAAEVGRDLRLLEHPDRSAEDRQQSVTCVLDATWERLEPRDRSAAERLCCFRSSFTREDATAVADVGVSSLVRLIERSLVRQRAAGRFDLHPLVARYAAERAMVGGEAAALERRHAAHFSALLERHEQALMGPDRVSVGAALARAHGDLRSAWTWSLEHDEDALWQACAAAFGRYLEVIGRYRDGADWLGAAAGPREQRSGTGRGSERDARGAGRPVARRPHRGGDAPARRRDALPRRRGRRRRRALRVPGGRGGPRPRRHRHRRDAARRRVGDVRGQARRPLEVVGARRAGRRMAGARRRGARRGGVGRGPRGGTDAPR